MKIVGSKPAIPGIAETQISDFLFILIELKLFNILVFLIE